MGCSLLRSVFLRVLRHKANSSCGQTLSLALYKNAPPLMITENRIASSGVADGGEGVRASPPGRLNVKNGPPC